MIGSRKKLHSVAMLLVGFFVCYSLSIAQVPDPQNPIRKFVQEFYDWYGMVLHKSSKLAPDERAIKEKAQIFSQANRFIKRGLRGIIKAP